MSKVIQVTGKWEGSVEIADPLNIAQATLITEAVQLPKQNEDGSYYLVALDSAKLPAIIGCVTAWNIKDFPEKVTFDNFPASPRKASHALIDMIFAEIMKVYNGETKVPNE